MRALQLIARHKAALIVCGLFSAAGVIGAHVVLPPNLTQSSLETNYITNLQVVDIFFFLGLWALSAAGFIAAVQGLRRLQSKLDFGVNTKDLSMRRLAIMTVVLLCAWTPYFFAFAPGFVEHDLTTSLAQLQGLEGFNNHHPISYTLFIGACISIAQIWQGGVADGIALASLIQMCALATSFAYILEWVQSRFSLRFFAPVACAFLAMSSYVVSFALATWKDPLFSAAFIFMSVIMAEILVSKGGWLKGPRRISMLVLAIGGVCLLRSNGPVVLLASLLPLTIASWVASKRKSSSSSKNPSILGAQSMRFALSLATVLCLGVCLILSYALPRLGVAPAARVEALGVPLNQMARVAALGKDLSPEETRYLNDRLSLERYRQVYTPACVDPIKWDPGFTGLGNPQDMLYSYISLILHHPQIMSEAWVLQTSGYWDWFHGFDYAQRANIFAGEPLNYTQGGIKILEPFSFSAAQAQSFGSTQANLQSRSANLVDTCADSLRSLLVIDGVSVPLSWCLWIYLAATMLLLYLHKSLLAATLLLPTLLLLTLLPTAPIAYWARYGFAAQALLILVAAMLASLIRQIWQYSKSKELL